MSSVCSYSAPWYHKMILEIIGLFAIPLNFLVFYLIWKDTSAKRGYKYVITFMQAMAFIAETDISVFTWPWYYFPLLAGYSQSAVSIYLNIPTHTLMLVYTFFLTFELPACLQCFYYRFEETRTLKYRKGISKISFLYILISYTYPFLTAYFLNSIKTPRERQIEILSEKYPECLHLFDIPSFELYDTQTDDVIYLSVYFMIIMVVSFAFAIYFAVATFVILNTLRNMVSSRTYKFHFHATINLFVLTLCPFVLCVFPLVFCFFIVFFDMVELQQYGNFSMLGISIHSSVISVLILTTKSKYRNVIRDWFSTDRTPVQNVFVKTIESNQSMGFRS